MALNGRQHPLQPSAAHTEEPSRHPHWVRQLAALASGPKQTNRHLERVGGPDDRAGVCVCGIPCIFHWRGNDRLTCADAAVAEIVWSERGSR